MSDENYGLSRRKLEYHLRWLLRKTPQDAKKLPEFLGEVMITLIDKNNTALAKSAADQDRPDMPDTF
jgi:hypothetical protein